MISIKNKKKYNDKTKPNDEYFMQLALKEAEKADDSVYPNPKVGALVVANNKIISKGYHKCYGKEHAEFKAIKSIGRSLSNATLYVNLEPCSHQGKTAPCTDLIDNKIFKRVVIGAKDPNPKASGGAKILREKNIEVVENVCLENSKKINRRFYTFFEKKRPYVILKIATTLDGFIAELDGYSKWITNKKSRESVHKLRATCDAILVGRKTIEIDNPSLTSHGHGKDPKIVILDTKNIISKKSDVFKNNPIVFSGKELVHNYKENINYVLNELYKRSYQTVLVEGGGKTFSAFLDSDLFDELNIYYAPKIIGDGKPLYIGNNALTKDYKLQLHKTEHFDYDIKMTFYKGN